MNERSVVFLYEEKTPNRLDRFLVSCLPEFSRTRLQSLIKAGLVTVDSEPVRKAGQVLEAGARVHVIIPPTAPAELLPEEIPLDIIFENQDVIVVNKPAGMVVHPSAGHATSTLVHAALAQAPEINGVGGKKRPGVVHRLDKETSGLILLAKNDAAHHWLQDQFRHRQVEKIYLALLDGHPPTPEGRVEAAIGRDPRQRSLMAVVPSQKGREAVSIYHTCQVFPRHTLVEVHPLTGRTHQIRLHMAMLGCPVVGDKVYGHKHPSLPVKRHFLHASRLAIVLPGETKKRVFEAVLPDDLKQVLLELDPTRSLNNPWKG
jgi:23S rRNA pseudouridine1911/1915/1917 synthase